MAIEDATRLARTKYIMLVKYPIASRVSIIGRAISKVTLEESTARNRIIYGRKLPSSCTFSVKLHTERYRVLSINRIQRCDVVESHYYENRVPSWPRKGAQSSYIYRSARFIWIVANHPDLCRSSPITSEFGFGTMKVIFVNTRRAYIPARLKLVSPVYD